MNIKIGILNVPKHCNKHDLIHFVTVRHPKHEGGMANSVDLICPKHEDGMAKGVEGMANNVQ